MAENRRRSWIERGMGVVHSLPLVGRILPATPNRDSGMASLGADTSCAEGNSPACAVNNYSPESGRLGGTSQLAAASGPASPFHVPQRSSLDHSTAANYHRDEETELRDMLEEKDPEALVGMLQKALLQEKPSLEPRPLSPLNFQERNPSSEAPLSASVASRSRIRSFSQMLDMASHQPWPAASPSSSGGTRSSRQLLKIDRNVTGERSAANVVRLLGSAGAMGYGRSRGFSPGPATKRARTSFTSSGFFLNGHVSAQEPGLESSAQAARRILEALGEVSTPMEDGRSRRLQPLGTFRGTDDINKRNLQISEGGGSSSNASSYAVPSAPPPLRMMDDLSSPQFPMRHNTDMPIFPVHVSLTAGSSGRPRRFSSSPKAQFEHGRIEPQSRRRMTIVREQQTQTEDWSESTLWSSNHREVLMRAKLNGGQHMGNNAQEARTRMGSKFSAMSSTDNSEDEKNDSACTAPSSSMKASSRRESVELKVDLRDGELFSFTAPHPVMAPLLDLSRHPSMSLVPAYEFTPPGQLSGAPQDSAQLPFSFSMRGVCAVPESRPVSVGVTSPATGFDMSKFGLRAGQWKCKACLVVNEKGSSKCAACESCRSDIGSEKEAEEMESSTLAAKPRGYVGSEHITGPTASLQSSGGGFSFTFGGNSAASATTPDLAVPNAPARGSTASALLNGLVPSFSPAPVTSDAEVASSEPDTELLAPFRFGARASTGASVLELKADSTPAKNAGIDGKQPPESRAFTFGVKATLAAPATAPSAANTEDSGMSKPGVDEDVRQSLEKPAFTFGLATAVCPTAATTPVKSRSVASISFGESYNPNAAAATADPAVSPLKNGGALSTGETKAKVGALSSSTLPYAVSAQAEPVGTGGSTLASARSSSTYPGTGFSFGVSSSSGPSSVAAPTPAAPTTALTAEPSGSAILSFNAPGQVRLPDEPKASFAFAAATADSASSDQQLPSSQGFFFGATGKGALSGDTPATTHVGFSFGSSSSNGFMPSVSSSAGGFGTKSAGSSDLVVSAQQAAPAVFGAIPGQPSGSFGASLNQNTVLAGFPPPSTATSGPADGCGIGSHAASPLSNIPPVGVGATAGSGGFGHPTQISSSISTAALTFGNAAGGFAGFGQQQVPQLDRGFGGSFLQQPTAQGMSQAPTGGFSMGVGSAQQAGRGMRGGRKILRAKRRAGR